MLRFKWLISSPKPRFQTEVKYDAISIKMIFYFQTLSLVLKVRVFSNLENGLKTLPSLSRFIGISMNHMERHLPFLLSRFQVEARTSKENITEIRRLDRL